MSVKYENKYFIFDKPRNYNASRFLKVFRYKIRSILLKILLKICARKIKNERKYDVCICGIFKNEGVYLKEWIEYHHLIGVQHFYLYNNNSTDDFRDILNEYINKGIVTLIEWPHNQAQMQAYMDCIKNYKDDTKWIGFIDIDEFIVPVKDNNIYSILSKFETYCGSVLLYWKLFGAGKYVLRDINKLVIEDFIVSAPKHSDIGKCFYNTTFDFDARKSNGLHHMLWTKFKKISIPPVDIFGNFVFSGFNPEPRDDFSVQINHYATKSYDEFKMKKLKGDVFYKINPHDETYFNELNTVCTGIDFSIYRWLILLKQKLNITA